MSVSFITTVLAIAFTSPYIIHLVKKSGGVFKSKDVDIKQKISVVVVVLCMFLEFQRGSLHFLYPIRSHTQVSKITDTYNLNGDSDEAKPLFLVTYQFGAANLILGFMYMVILMFCSQNLNALKSTLIFTFVIRLMQQINGYFRLWASDVFEAPNNNPITAPGKYVQAVQLLIIVIGLFCVVTIRTSVPSTSLQITTKAKITKTLNPSSFIF